MAIDHPNELGFFRDQTPGASPLALLLVGGYAVTATRDTRVFIFAPVQGGIQVTTAVEFSSANGFGQVDRKMVTAEPAVKADMNGLLRELKQVVESTVK